MTKPFCDGCNRVRLCADGNLKNCLFGKSESNLKDAMREGATDEHVMEMIQEASMFYCECVLI